MNPAATLRLSSGASRFATRSFGASALVTRQVTGTVSAGPTPARAAVSRRPGASVGAGAVRPTSAGARLAAGSGLASRTCLGDGRIQARGVAHVVHLAFGGLRHAGHALGVGFLEADADDIDDELGVGLGDFGRGGAGVLLAVVGAVVQQDHGRGGSGRHLLGGFAEGQSPQGPCRAD